MEKADILEAATKEARKDCVNNKVGGHKLSEGIKKKLAESRRLLEKRQLNRRESNKKTFETIKSNQTFINEAMSYTRWLWG